MATLMGAVNLAETRVPILIPLAATSAFGIAQLFLGSDPLIVLLCVAAITVTFIPLHFYGRDLYSFVAILFGVRYLAIALVAKTFYGQPLQSNLYSPLPTYLLTSLLMIVSTALVMLARSLDPCKNIVSFPSDPRSLRLLGLFSFPIGVLGLAIIGVNKTEGAEAASHAGALYVLGAGFASFCILGIVAEAAHGIEKSKGRTLVTPILIAMLVVLQLGAIALNTRAIMLSALIGLGVIAFIYKMIRLRYLVIAAAFGAFFTLFLTPVTVYLRPHKSLPIAQFIGLAGDTVVKAVIDPEFRKAISNETKYAAISNETPPYDYYGDRSNVMNRLSFVALLDAVYNGARGHTPLGMNAVAQTMSGSSLGFLGFKKQPYGSGDWLSWQMGILGPGEIAFLNFGLPMEGLAAWGLVGLIIYPLIFIFPLLVIFSRISSFRLAVPVSIFIFTDQQHVMIEGNSDSLLTELEKGVPLVIVLLLILYGLVKIFSGRQSTHFGLRRPLPKRSETMLPGPAAAE